MSECTIRKMAWPLEPGAAPKINELVAGLVDEFDDVRPGQGGQVILVELGMADAVEFLRLAERLTAAWEARGQDALVIDAHPAEPFTADCFENDPEGFTEILHYGLSPEAAVCHRDGCSGLWIPAGGKWSLPLESPDEPHLTLLRLADVAEKVLILADRDDAEGFLEAFRDSAHYRLILVPQDEAADLSPPSVGEPIGAPQVEAAPMVPPEAETVDPSPARASRAARTPVVVTGERGAGGRRRRLALLLLPILALAWYFALGPGRAPRDLEPAPGLAAGDSGFSHLPPPVELPYSGGGERPEPAREVEKPAADPAPAIDPGPSEERSPEPPARVDTESASEFVPVPARTAAPPRRRFESRELWRRIRTDGGVFYVHVESYRDSVLGASTARSRGFGAAGFALRPQFVRGENFYRLLVGPFPALSDATAYRDSLLDHTDENYCTIAVEASE